MTTLETVTGSGIYTDIDGKQNYSSVFFVYEKVLIRHIDKKANNIYNVTRQRVFDPKSKQKKRNLFKSRIKRCVSWIRPRSSK